MTDKNNLFKFEVGKNMLDKALKVETKTGNFNRKLMLLETSVRDFPDGPTIRTLHFQWR